MKQVRTPLLALFILIGLGAATAFAESAPEPLGAPTIQGAALDEPIAADTHPSGGDSLTGLQEQMFGANGGGDLAGCDESWYCTSWSCKENGAMTRTCFDRNRCGTEGKKPSESAACTFTASCYNGVVDGPEEGLDCGGNCPPCYTCNDNVRNQGEEGIDCGGPCGLCPSCHDGVRNQGEEGIDCGGPCPSCGSCDDGMKNQDEEGIDCGGPCLACHAQQSSGPFTFLAAIAAAMTLLMVNIVVSFHYGKGVLGLSKIKTVSLSPPSLKVRGAGKTLDTLDSLTSGRHRAKDVDTLRAAVHGFLASLYGLEKGFSQEDLSRSLKAGKADPMLQDLLLSYVSKLSQVSFAGKAMHEQEFKSLVREAQELIRLASPGDITIESRPRKVSIVVRAETGEEAFRLMGEAYEALGNGDPFLAAEYYHKALDIYERLPEQQKEDIFDSVRRLHREIDLFENVFNRR